ncbi:MAG: YHS domain-containing (seleno)protein [Pseudomonadota bacterium]
MLKTVLLATALATAPLAAAFAADEYNVTSGLTAAGAPLGLHGVDTVALSKTETVADGAAAHTVVHDGVAYYFASDEAKTMFEADPAAFLPQNGGFCTFGVAKGKKFDGNPNYAAVVDGKLYVFLNAEVFEIFSKDRAGVIAQAAENWPGIRSTPAGEL